MIKSKNKFISFGLSLLFFIAALDLNHHHEHEHKYLNRYSLFDLGSEVNDFHETSNQCVKCLIKVQRFSPTNSFDFSFQSLSSAFYFSEEMIFDTLISFDLNSRPPPFLL
tara:strand:+ start:137 stop:466 length:330 start_codon:yes stop_codon:yes gene_type:complete